MLETNQARGNQLPQPLRARVEQASGLDMGDISVRLGSAEPARFGAAAFARGSEIHVGPGQEEHLPHEAWHAVQQKRAAVAATTQVGGQAANRDPRLEAEADRMADVITGTTNGEARAREPRASRAQTPVLQLRFSSGDAALLSFYPQVSNDPSALTTLRDNTTRSARDLAGLLGRNVPGMATIAQIVALDRFSNRQIATLLDRFGSWDRAVQLASLPYTANDIIDIVTNGDPDWGEAWDTLRAFTPAEFAELAASGVNDWASIATLARTVLTQGSLTQLLQRVTAVWRAALPRDLEALRELGLNVDATRYEAALIGTHSLNVGSFQVTLAYLGDARYFSVCFDTADRLAALASTGAATYSSGGEKRATYPLLQQNQRMAQLTQDLAHAAASNAGFIFEVAVGGHGFTLTVLGPAVYQLESFASQAGTPFHGQQDLHTSLLASIHSARHYPLATIQQNLSDMVSAHVHERRRGANAMGWNPWPCGFLTRTNITDPDRITDPMAVWWSGSSLASQKDVLLRLSRHIQARRIELFNMLAGERPEQAENA